MLIHWKLTTREMAEAAVGSGRSIEAISQIFVTLEPLQIVGENVGLSRARA